MPDPLTGQELPNLMIQPIVINPIDDHQVHAAVTAAFLNSPIGIDLEKTNPVAYTIIMQHFMEHNVQVQLMMQAQAEQEQTNSKKTSESESVQ